MTVLTSSHSDLPFSLLYVYVGVSQYTIYLYIDTLVSDRK